MAPMLTADAIKHFGSRAAIARALGISRSAVSYWGEHVPALRAYQLRELLAARQMQDSAAAAEQETAAA